MGSTIVGNNVYVTGSMVITGSLVVNEDGDVVGDFRAESSNRPYALYVDATNDRIGLGCFIEPTHHVELQHEGGDGDQGLMIVRYDGAVYTNNLLGGVGFDNADPVAGIPSQVLEASSYVAGYAAENHSTTNKGGYLVFGTADIGDDINTATPERMRITSAGLVGIGTTSPAGALEVNASTAVIRIDSATDTHGKLEWAEDGTRKWLIYNDYTDDNLTFKTNTVVRMVIEQAGNIGIGTSSPGTLLDVDGTFRSTGISLSNNDSGDNNTVFGLTAGEDLASGGNQNVLIGENAGKEVTTGDDNVIIGYNAGVATLLSGKNVIIGSGAAAAVMTAAADGSVVIGYGAGAAITSGDENTVVGHEALKTEDAGGGCTALGYKALSLQNVDSAKNTAVGNGAGQLVDASTQSTYIGFEAGKGAGANKPTGTGNTYVGYQAGTAHSHDAEHNTMVGHQAGDGLAQADQNTGVGSAVVFATSSDNQTAIGYAADTSALGPNTVKIGNGSISRAHIQVDWTIDSDRRIKQDIEDSALGLSFINDLSPRKYRKLHPADWAEEIREKRYETDERDEFDDAKVWDGLIAQEVKEAVDKSGTTFSGWSVDANGKQGIQYSALVVPLIKAVQELSTEVGSLKAKIETLKNA